MKEAPVPLTLTAVDPLKPFPRITMDVPGEPLAGMKEASSGAGVVWVVVPAVVVSGVVIVVETVVSFDVNVVVIVSATFAPAPPTNQRPVASPAAATTTKASHPFSPATVQRAYNDARRRFKTLCDDLRGPRPRRGSSNEPRRDAFSPEKTVCARYGTSTTAGEVANPWPETGPT